MVTAGFGGLGAWAALAPLQSAVLATGSVKVSSERKTLQHPRAAWSRRSWYARATRSMREQVLVRLDDITARARVDLLRAKLDRMAASLARIQAEQTGLDEIRFPDDLLACPGR